MSLWFTIVYHLCAIEGVECIRVILLQDIKSKEMDEVGK